MEMHPLGIWTFIFGTLGVWMFGMLAFLYPWMARSERGSALWLLAPVLWPLALPFWAVAAWREHREAAAYLALPKPLNPDAPPVRLVAEGIPYGSPLPADGMLAREVRFPQTYMNG
ncbi:MAG: hypothetical protein KDB82_16415 [Planctomycetes bacterium]|nr:hypothetical protein [Planctomycetota bacterium]